MALSVASLASLSSGNSAHEPSAPPPPRQTSPVLASRSLCLRSAARVVARAHAPLARKRRRFACARNSRRSREAAANKRDSGRQTPLSSASTDSACGNTGRCALSALRQTSKPSSAHTCCCRCHRFCGRICDACSRSVAKRTQPSSKLSSTALVLRAAQSRPRISKHAPLPCAG